MSIGLPYMGSKRKLAAKILQTITARHERITDFYDLFGGGGAVSFEAVKNYKFNVHYNELNKAIFSLIKYLADGGAVNDQFYKWVSREDFFKEINKPNPDFFTGLVMSCWSFGNDQRTYIYGAEIEELKRNIHLAITTAAPQYFDNLEIDFFDLNQIQDVHERANIFLKRYNEIKNTSVFAENSTRIKNVEKLASVTNLYSIRKIRKGIKPKILNTTNCSYEDVIIKGESPVIYCDIPYKGTKEYKERKFDYDAFYNWASGVDFPVYISEYAAPFECVEVFAHKALLNQNDNNKKVVERLFWNGKGEVFKHKLF